MNGPTPSRARMLAALVLALLLAAPAILMRIGAPEITNHMEALTFAGSQETWLRQQAGEASAWVIPVLNGAPRVNKPPMVTWMNLVGWAGLGPETPVDVLVERSRLLGAGMILLMVASVFWLGTLAGGLRRGLLAAVMAGTMFLTMKQGRMATYDCYLAGWLTLAIAAGAAALYRRGAGGAAGPAWRALGAGVALAAAVLTKGPLALVLAAVALAAFARDAREGQGARRGATLAVVFGVALGLAVPWYALLVGADGQASRMLAAEFRGDRAFGHPAWQNVQFLGLSFPWSLAVAGGLALPWLARRGAEARRFEPAWWWFVLGFVVLSFSETKRARYLLPLVPPAALLAASWWVVWREFEHRWWQRLAGLQWAVLTAGAVVVAVLPWLQQALVRGGVLEAAEIPVEPAWVAVPAGLALLLVARGGAWAWRARRLSLAALCVAAWMAGATSFANAYYVDSRHGRFAGRAAYEAVGETIGATPVRYFESDARAQRIADAKLPVYTRLAIPPIRAEELAALAREPAFVIARETDDHARLLAAAGFTPVRTFLDGRRPFGLHASPGAAR